MISIKKSLPVILACILATACNESEDSQSTLTVTSTNTAESPLPLSSNSLQDIWVLDSINNMAPDSNYFAHGTPYFDFNPDKGTVSGHTGCNGLNGKLNVDAGKIRVDSLDVAKEVC